MPDVDRACSPKDGVPVGQPSNLPARPQHVHRQEIAVQKNVSVLRRRRRHDIKCRLPHSWLLCVDRYPKFVSRDPGIRPRSEHLRGEIEGMQQYSNLRDPRHPRPRFRRIEVNMPPQPCHQQRWRAPRRCTSNISSQDFGTGSPLPATTPRLAISFSKLPSRPSRPGTAAVRRTFAFQSLDSQPMHGGADATGQSAIANDTWRDNEFVGRVSLTPGRRADESTVLRIPKSPSCRRRRRARPRSSI